MTNPEHLIRHLDLKPHPEGGFYRETYRSPFLISRDALPPGFHGPTAVSTSIYFLLTADTFSALHRIRSDEVWHFYDGDPLTVSMISPEGTVSDLVLGRDLTAGNVYQGWVPAGHWFGARVRSHGRWSLVGCTVAPGFQFEDFEMARRSDLSTRWPHAKSLIEDLTRE